MTEEFLNQLKKVFEHKYQGPGEFKIIKNYTTDIQIKGFKHNEIRLEIAKIIDKAKTYKVPEFWEDVIHLLNSDDQCITKPVKQGTDEWNRLVLGFKLTMPGATIHEIQRIQNKKLWRVFQNEVDDVRQKNGQEPQIAEMYHGTSGTNPELIYKSEEGFDMRYSNQGMWGHANYFAKNSSYSNSYAHSISNGKRQMFVANVLIGVPAVLAPDRSLKFPPINPATHKPYDSVQGNTGGSDVIMVYSNKKAYPQYLVTYSQ